MADNLNTVSARVTEISSSMTQLVTKIEKMSAAGKSFKEIFDEVQKTFKSQEKSAEDQLAAINKLTEATKQQLKTGEQSTENIQQQEKTLRKLVTLEKQLKSEKDRVLSSVDKITQSAVREQKLALETAQFEKTAALEKENANKGAAESAKLIKEIEARLAKEAVENAEKKKNAEQQLRDQIKEGNARRTEEVKAFESRSKGFQQKRQARLKELGQLEAKQSRDRQAAAKTQLDIDLKILNRGKMTLEQRRDAQKKLISDYRKQYSVQSNDYKKLTLRLLKLDESYEKQIADRDRKIDKGRKDTAKKEEDRVKRLSKARREVFKAELDLSKKSAKEKLKDVKTYYDRELREIKLFKGKDSEEYKKIYAERLRLQSKYEKQSNSQAKSAAASERKSSAAAPAAPRRTSFLEGLSRGFQGGAIGQAVGRLTGVGAVVGLLRKSYQLLEKAIVSSFKASVAYEAQLAQLQAVTGVTNEELETLSKSVLSVAGSTTFTSEEIVQLQTELGKLGFSAEEIANATQGIAQTAQALGEKVGPVAQKVGQILKQYNLNSSETEKISDTLVTTINSSALSFESFGTALQYVGPLAAEVGTEFEETAAAMAILADNGFTASRIGTGLRGILTELSSTGEDLTTVIERLAGENLSFSEAIELVGKRNAAQLISLVDNVALLSDAESKYYQAGSAAIASAQQIDTYKGNLQLLNSALNKVSISFGDLIKNSSILRLALKLIDEEGYKATLSAEQLAEANRDIYSSSLEESSKALAGISKNNSEILNESQAAAEKVVEKSLIEPLLDEYAQIQQDYKKRTVELIGREQAETGAEVEKILSDDQIKALKERRNEITELLGRDNFDVELFGDGSIITADIDEILKNFTESIKTTKEQLEELTDQQRLDKVRDDIQAQFKEDLDERRRLKREEFNSDFTGLAKAAAFQKSNENAVKRLRDEVNASKAEELKLTGYDLELQKAKTTQLEQEKQNYVNLLYTREELFAFAQKEFELEFKSLQNALRDNKQELQSKNELLDVEIETLQNRIESNITEEEKKKLIEEQLELENQKLINQDEAYEKSQELLAAQNKELEDAKKLWSSLGYDVRLLDKAFARLEGIELSEGFLKVDFEEIEEAARTLADSFQKKFGEQFKEGQELTQEQDEWVKAQVKNLVENLGKNLTEEERKALSELVLSGLYADDDETKKDALKKAKDVAKLILGAIADAAEAYNQTALENTRNRLKSELDAIKERYKTEEQILKSQLDNQLITESQYRTKQNELKKKQIAEENEINKQIFEAEKKADINNVAIDTLEAIASNAIRNYGSSNTGTAAIQTALGYAAIVAAGAAKADAIRRRKFFPVKFEQGGIVEGPSHSQGGVPFSVQGQGGYEMEGGEFIVNKRAAQFHRSLLERINGSVKPNTAVTPLKFATGGLVQSQNAVRVLSATTDKESVNYLKAIAEATVSTAMSSNKPVRAFVSERDLRTSENERRLKERNDRI